MDAHDREQEHDKQAEQLSKIALSKDFDSLLEELDESVSDEDDERSFHGVHDGIQAGLKRSKKQVWAFLIDEDKGLIEPNLWGFLIGDSFEKVKARLDKLPPKKDEKEEEDEEDA